MSETNAQATTTDPVPNAPSVDPPAPAPRASGQSREGVDPSPAPDPAQDANAPAEQTEEEKRDEEQKQQAGRGDKRFAMLTARLAAAERVQEQQRAELEFRRAQEQAQRPPGQPLTPEEQQQQLVRQIRAEEAAKLRAEQFHEQGRAEFPDWQQRCADLMKIGADPGFAALLVGMPGGAKVAAALADDPEVVQRIAAIDNEPGRAVALGKYAATVEAPRAPAPVTRAPAPVRPVSGRASPAFNEYTASAQELVDHYLKPAKR